MSTNLSERRVLLAAPRGYCAGVHRAVAAVERALELFGAPVYVRGQIVHNSYVVRRLAGRGAVFVDEVEEVPAGGHVVFSAHGVSPEVRARAQARGLDVIDATCPLVAKVHKEAARYAAGNYSIVLIGHAHHEEIEGTAGEAPDAIRVIEDAADVDGLDVPDPARVVWLSQTTLSVDDAARTVEALRGRFPGLTDPPSDDICYATQNRQAAVKLIAPRCDLVIVVGSANSSNSARLVEVALGAGAGAAHLVDDAAGIDPAWLAGAATVGVTSGASVPEALVDGVLERLEAAGFPAPEEVRGVEEHLTFAPPHQLRSPR